MRLRNVPGAREVMMRISMCSQSRRNERDMEGCVWKQ